MSSPTLEQLQRWLIDAEDERLEFKEAKTQFDSDRLTKYCVALANEGGGHIVLGVTDKQPRVVVGTKAFENLSSLKRDQSQRVRLRIDAIALDHADGRVVVVTVPPRPIGTPIEYRGAYWMRRGEDLVAMSAEVLGPIFDEGQPDYSAQICPAAALADVDEAAIERLRSLWMASSKNTQLASLDRVQLLEDTGLTIDGEITYAALILLGTQKGLGRHLAQAETIFEYRSSDGSIPAQQRQEFRKGFLLYLDELWALINLRNEVHQFQDGLFRRSVHTFNERAVREALLNALAHRDYRMGGSIFVRQYPKRLEIVSPGGFPLGITAENLLWKQAPRNRRVAEVMGRCDLVERSGQGADLMFSTCIQESKALPDFSASDDYEVSLVLSGEVQDEQFLRYLERVGAETLAHFNSGDFLLLDAIHRELPISDRLRGRLPKLLELGIIERRARRGSYLLSERFYQLSGRSGAYARRKGLDRETNKALLLKHIKRNKAEGSPFGDLQDVLPAQSRPQVQRLLAELKREGKASTKGKTRAARWYPGATEPKEGQP
ncbi:MAG: putative DNA binding domain-containing protein [Candidatus Eisenbacteria sp.]|nr:putative DNA binding domain-containing protein [Candidatus Eisenbacteria bacterium]